MSIEIPLPFFPEHITVSVVTCERDQGGTAIAVACERCRRTDFFYIPFLAARPKALEEHVVSHSMCGEVHWP